LYFKEIRIF